MNKRMLMAIGATVGVAGLALVIHQRSAPVDAADHSDSPAASLNANADLTDFYAWMVDDATNVALIMNVDRNAAAGDTFPTNTYYQVNLNRGGMDSKVLCKFEAADNIDCWIGTAASNTYITGDASDAAAPLISEGVSVFAGQRDDPFFFNVAGFSATTGAVQATCVQGAPTCDDLINADGCPDLTTDLASGDFPTLGQALVNCLTTQCDVGLGDNTNSAAVDDFANANILSLTLRVPISMIPGTGNIKAYATTHAVN